ncbi:MAG: hypothetical protein GIX03_07965 [Candidatus Eremiobacteraeota bacterium]|nr:hypothetical protein [Candidatus Eremiobacteraeota bacterium]MBC5802923.1 hypothetical protein [Candidatus Eremiobacteraeota bacterium]MBC5822632.1 hypothetical protein [Candidatus Eremiobacteraeota bacterium]
MMDPLDASRAIVHRAAEKAHYYEDAMARKMLEHAERITAARRAGVDDGKPKTIEETVEVMCALLAVPGVRIQGTLVRETVMPLFPEFFQHGYGLAYLEGRVSEYEALLGAFGGES